MPGLLYIILGNVALLCVVMANVMVYSVKAALRKRGYPVSWLSYPGMHNDFASLRRMIAAAPYLKERLACRRWRRRLVVSYIAFGLGVALLLTTWISWAFLS